MKKSALIVLLMVTVSFAAFIGGFYLGRNYNHAPVQVSSTQATAPTAATTAGISATHAATSAPSLIDINTATLAQLESLPGIGAVKAQAIIDYRDEHGRFTSVQDLLNVPGIGEKTLEKFIDHITVGG